MPRGRTTTLTITLNQDEMARLRRLLKQRRLRAGLARRARLIMLRENGETVSAISQTVGMTRRHIYKWLWRWQAEGLAGLRDLPGRGRKRGIRVEKSYRFSC